MGYGLTEQKAALGFESIYTFKKPLDIRNFNAAEFYELHKDSRRDTFIMEIPYQGKRVSIVCCEALFIIRIAGERVHMLDSERREIYSEKGDALEFLRNIRKLFVTELQGIDEISQSLFTLVSYDAARQFEKKKLSIVQSNEKVPDFWAVIPKTIVVIDRDLQEGALYVNCTKDSANPGLIKSIFQKYNGHQGTRIHQTKTADTNLPVFSADLTFNVTKEEYCRAVEKAKEYIVSGDVFQVVLSVECSVETQLSPVEIFENMHKINKGTFNYLIESEEFAVVGASPEILVQKTGEECTIRPLAGTIAHHGAKDKAKEEALLGNEKDCAEHRMLVDLCRNDLGRVCEYNTVIPKKLMEVEYYYNVMHIVSEIKGVIRKDKDCYDLFKASFPAGTMTGTPKIRAMEIIDELENKARGFYSGGVGFFTAGGDIYTYIVIRSLMLAEGNAYARSGAGIVFDSVPEQEYQECVNKLRNALKSLREEQII